MTNEFRNLVFEGGGVKGVAYGGALKQLQAMGVLQKVRRVAGTSAGAIIGTLIAVGHDADELTDILESTDYRQFQDPDWGDIREVWRFWREFGWSKGEAFLKWIGDLIKDKTGDREITFGRLKVLQEQLGHERIKELWTVGANLTERRSEHFSWETTPKMPVRDAARVSMSLPFLFRSVRSRFKHDVLVDGGMLENYPLNIFDRRKFLFDKANGDEVDYHPDLDYVFNHETLGFRLHTEKEYLFDTRGWGADPPKIENIVEFSRSILNIVTEEEARTHLHENDWNRTVYIDALGVRATDFHIDQAKVRALIHSGRVGVKRHFDWRNGPDGMTRP